MKIKNLRIPIIIFYFFHLFTVQLMAQDNCAMTLKKAENLFDNGRIDDIPSMLQACLQDGFDKSQKIRAYELIIQCYITEDERAKADEYMLKLLKLDPNYQSEKNVVSTDFSSLINTMEAEPFFTFGIRGGINISQISVIEEYGLHNIDSVSGKYSSGAGFQVGLQLSKSIIKNLEFGIDPMFVQHSYNYNLNSAFAFCNIAYTEKVTSIDVPCYFVYRFPIKKVSPFVKLGLQSGFLISSSIQATRDYNDDSHNNLSSSNINVKDRREQVNFDAIFGFGVRYQINKGYVVLDLAYNKGLRNSTVASKRYSENELMYDYYIVDDDKYFNNFVITVGYSYSIYKPKKAKDKE